MNTYTPTSGPIRNYLNLLYQKTPSTAAQQDFIASVGWTQRDTDTGNTNGSVGAALNIDISASTGYICYVTGGGSYLDCSGTSYKTSQGRILVIAKLTANGCSVGKSANFGYTKYNWYQNENTLYRMTFSKIGNTFTCAVDLSATGDSRNSITWSDPSPLPTTNTFMGFYTLSGGYRFCDYDFSRCSPPPPPPPSTSTTSTTSSPTTSSTTSSTSSSTTSSTSSLITSSTMSLSSSDSNSPLDTNGLIIASSSASSSTWIYITVASVVFGILVLLIVLLFILFMRYRRRSQGHIPMSSIPVRAGSIASSIPIDDPKSTTIDHVEMKEELGSGNFGMVYRGIYQGTEVALKGLKTSHQDEFAKEAEVIKQLSHPNVVQYMGLYTDPKGIKYIVMEYLPHGALSTLLQKNPQKFNSQDLIQLSKHASAGMMHLESKRFVHRDLALRNLLVGNYNGNYIVKISDFGLSRSIGTSYYRSDADIPIKWSAPEVLEYGTHTTKSDVWSFGIVLWEIFSYGKLPYPEFSNDKTREMVIKGYIMPSPPHCDGAIYDLMLECWKRGENERPSFVEIHRKLEQLSQEVQSHSRRAVSSVADLGQLYAANGIGNGRPFKMTSPPMKQSVSPGFSPSPTQSPMGSQLLPTRPTRPVPSARGSEIDDRGSISSPSRMGPTYVPRIPKSPPPTSVDLYGNNPNIV